jgi:flagellar protein FlaI
MAEITKGYPFSAYKAEKKQLNSEQQEVASFFISLIRRKRSVESFCQRFPAASAQDVQNFLDSLDILSESKPLPMKEKSELLKDLTSLLQFVPASEEVAGYVLSETRGYILLQPLFDDNDLEEIMVNGPEQVFVYHRKAGICKTDLRFKNEELLNALIAQMGFDPSLGYSDLRLADGSRANIVVPPLVNKPSITVRKFTQKPFSIIDLIHKHTLTPEMAAYLWVAVEGLIFYPLNIIIAGGTAAGKTTSLNALSSLIPPSDRIVTIEDTLELNFFEREDWIQMVTSNKTDVHDLLKNCLRMRPDRIMMGDIRGEEASTLFTAMNTGHRGVMGTLHANNDRDAIKRLESPPMLVPRSMIPLADIVIIQHRVYDRRHGLIRRITQVSEISRIEDAIALNPVFSWNQETDSMERSKFSSEAVEKLSNMTNLSKNEVKAEMDDRQRVLEYLMEKGVSNQVDVNKFMEKYYERFYTQVAESGLQEKTAAAKRATITEV